MTDRLPVNTFVAPITTASLLKLQQAFSSPRNTAIASRSFFKSTDDFSAAGPLNISPPNPPASGPTSSHSPSSSRSALSPTCPPTLTHQRNHSHTFHLAAGLPSALSSYPPRTHRRNTPIIISIMVVWLAGPNRVRVEEEVYNQVVDCHSPNATAEQIEVLMQKLGHRSPGLEVIVAVIAEIKPNCTGTYAGNKRK